MGWSVTVYFHRDLVSDVAPCSEHMLTPAEIEAEVRTAWPAARFQTAPSLAEKEALLGFQFPDAVRNAMDIHKRPRTGEYEEAECSFELSGLEGERLGCFSLEVRGRGDPYPVLLRLCAPRGWLVVTHLDGKIVDLRARDDTPWGRFRRWIRRRPTA